MSVEKAKEFLVDVSENEEVSARIESAYISALLTVSTDLGYDLTSDDLTVAIEEMTGLGEGSDDEEQVGGFGIDYTFAIRDSIMLTPGSHFGSIGDPLRLFSRGRFRRP